MSFEQRNSSWDGTPQREFRQLHSRTSAPRVWVVSVLDNSVFTSWGQLGGVMQTAVEHFKGVNVGKKNEMSPEAYALDRAKEMCRKKHWEGYREFSNGMPMDEVVERLITFDSLPLSLCFYKPDNSLGAGIKKKAETGKAWYTRKRNGLMYVISKGSERAKLYSRRMLRQHDNEKGTQFTWDDRFPHIVDAADKVMPNNSILLGEMVATDLDGNDHFKFMQSWSKSLTQQALSDISMAAGYSGVFPAFYVWDVAFWDGQDLVSNAPVRARYDLIHEAADWPLLPIEVYYGNAFEGTSHAVDHAKAMNWEGFVVVDPEGVYEDKAYNFKGKPDRPGKYCGKLKPEFEDDFIVYWNPDEGIGERSTKGRYNDGIKSVALYQLNSAGELVYISNCASGMTEEMKRDWADPSKYPQVWQVTYTGRRYQSAGDDTNALDFPRFTALRADKDPMECVNAKLDVEEAR